jgi:hypothetical protein
MVSKKELRKPRSKGRKKEPQSMMGCTENTRLVIVEMPAVGINGIPTEPTELAAYWVFASVPNVRAKRRDCKE